MAERSVQEQRQSAAQASHWTSNFHTHTPSCDGAGEMEQYVEEAVARGLSLLGFSPHAPLPFHADWVMAEPAALEYRRGFSALKEKYRGRIDLLCGAEADYIPDLVNPPATKRKYGFDFVIGSVHYLGQRADGTHWTVDGSLVEFETGVADTFGGNVRKAVERYYAIVREMVLRFPPDIVGHMDLVKMHNRSKNYFSDRESWYREAVLETLQAIAGSACVLEVNTGGIVRGKVDELYPADWILSECAAFGIPLTIDSDAHRPEQTAGLLQDTYVRLRQLGCRIADMKAAFTPTDRE